MQTVGERLLGLIIMVTGITQLTLLIIVRGRFTCRRFGESSIARAYNLLNFLTVWLITPAVSIILIRRKFSIFNVFQFPTDPDWLIAVFEITGLLIYATALILVSAGRIALGRNFQLGGLKPREGDALITHGIYRYIRHPMYSSLFYLALGLYLLVQSLILLILFIGILMVVLRLIAYEEKVLLAKYGDEFLRYCKRTGPLFPVFIHNKLIGLDRESEHEM